jgi:cell division protein FtsB
MLGVFSWFGVKYFIQRYNIEQSKERLGQKKEELQALVIKNELLVKELQKIKEPEYLRQKALKKGYGHAGEELLKPVD